MSLLIMAQQPEFQQLTTRIYTRQMEDNAHLQKVLNARAREKMYQDVQYNVDFLYTALRLEDDGIFEKYARWLYHLLCPLMTYCIKEQVRDIMIEHYELIRSCMEGTVAEGDRPKLHRLLDIANKATLDEYENDSTDTPRSGKYKTETKQFLDCLLRADTRGAVNLIAQYIKAPIPLEDICVDIIAETMQQVGELWHQNKISVDMEHYCTSITQLALSQIYPLVFGQERIGKSVVVACVGSELHEMGARMVADLFEYSGWDSIYLGAAVPAESIESAVVEHQPDLVALSVTMPQHLHLCREAVDRLRSVSPQIKIAVGGNAFSGTDLWRSWDVIHTRDARQLVQWAKNNL